MYFLYFCVQLLFYGYEGAESNDHKNQSMYKHGARVMMQLVKPPSVTLAFHIGVPGEDPAALLPNQLLANVPVKSVNDGLSTWAPEANRINRDGVPGF